MDYKTNGLNELVQCEEILLPDFPSMHYGKTPDGTIVFDSTRFYDENNIEEVDYRSFQRMMRSMIESIVNNSDATVDNLFYSNRDTHILINQELTFLFLAFAAPNCAAYFSGILGELFSNGVAYSDGFVISQAAERIPSDILRKIISDREKSEQRN